MAEAMKAKIGLVLLAFACASLPAACRSAPNLACPTTDVPMDRDEATATRAAEVASARIGMADVRTTTEQRSFQEGGRTFSLDQGGDEWVLTQVSRSELVDGADIRSAVAALEDEGFKQKRSKDEGMLTYTLERGAQRATVSLGPRLRGNNGRVEARVQVDTGCRPAAGASHSS